MDNTNGSYTINIQRLDTLNIYNMPPESFYNENEIEDGLNDICECGHNHDYVCDDCENKNCDQHGYSLEPLEELK